MHAMLDCGGPEFTIQVDGKRFRFEWHPWCGPIAINLDGSESAKQPHTFLLAASLWAKQGKRMEGDLCRWDQEPEMITRHIVGRNYKFVGFKPPVRGE